MRKGSAARAKHLLRRYFVLMQHVQRGEVAVQHVPDEHNPADFLTKFVPANKLRDSLRFVTGATVHKGRTAQFPCSRKCDA